jgi:hypothetical protein
MNGNLQDNMGPTNEDNPCPNPFDKELKIANVPNQLDLSFGGMVSEMIE